MQPGGVIFEFVRVGTALKVIAVDSGTGLEVSVVVPAGTRQADAERLALRKLRRRLTDGPDSGAASAPSGSGGIMV